MLGLNQKQFFQDGSGLLSFRMCGIIVAVGFFQCERIQCGGVDVIHSWFVPSFGVQEYAVIGRTNESWVKIDREGTFYGQCNQICGVNHPFMPIEVKAVSSDKFKTWSACAKAAANDQARAACYAPLETADADETEKDTARVAANAPASDVVK